MEIIVCAKQIVDVSDIKIDDKTNEPILKGVDDKISDIDKNAVEEGIKIKDELGGNLTVLLVGPSEATENIKELLAMGADRAVMVPWDGSSSYDVVSKIIAGVIEKIGDHDLILCGEASLDLFSGQTGPRIAALLDLPQITYAQSLDAEDEKIVGHKDVGGKVVSIESTYPVLVTVTKEINEPRLPSLMDILGASNKPMDVWDAESLVSDDLQPGLETVEIKGVPMERKKIVFHDDLDESIEKVVEKLAKEGVLG